MRLRYFVMALLLIVSCGAPESGDSAPDADRPNVIIVITDDQGYGDLGITGNSVIKTPAIDAFARESVRFNNFYVSPVCAPTRSSLMTGRYSLRTGVHDTYNGGAIMAASEVTIAEMLKNADYRTGIFGKWHLGDNYPSRPMDQGFDESLIHLAGGMGQVGDFTNYFAGRDSSYFDPVLWRDGKTEQHEGYCSDIFTDNAIEFIQRNAEQPFFCYVSYNAPHVPLQVPQKYLDMYAAADPATALEAGREISEKDKEDARKVYGMVTNIDDNFQKLLRTLDEMNIADNTIVIFMTDNGPQQRRYNAAMKGRKSDVYRGGTRVPFFLRYPRHFSGDQDIEVTTAHIDVLPTLAELCGVARSDANPLDGQNFLPLMRDQEVDWADRSLFFYWTRKFPELYQNMAIQRGGYKLVGRTDYDSPLQDFELYEVNEDPAESINLISEQSALAEDLKQEMDAMYAALVQERNLTDLPRIVIGSVYENPTILNRNDAAGQRGVWSQDEIFGKWRVSITSGRYNIRYKFQSPIESGGRMYLETGTRIHQMTNEEDTDVIEMNDVLLPSMDCDLIPFYAHRGKRIFPFWVEMERIGEPL